MKRSIVFVRAVMTCEPATLSMVALAATAIGTGVSTYSAYQSGRTAKKAGEYNAEMGRRNAEDALQRGAVEAAERTDRARKAASSQAEGMAMSGVDISTGTPLDLLVETAGIGKLDAMRTMNNATREAWGYKAQADLDDFQGKAAGRAGILNAGSTFLTGASNAYYGYRKK